MGQRLPPRGLRAQQVRREGSHSRCKGCRCPQVTHGTRKGQAGAGKAELWTSPGLPCKRGTDGQESGAKHVEQLTVRRHGGLGACDSASVSQEEATEVDGLTPMRQTVF